MSTREVTSQYRCNQWTKIIRECRSSGQTVTVWCAENNINPSSYYYWLRRLRKAACEALPSINEGNPIVPVNIPLNAVKTESLGQKSLSDIIVRIGTVTLEISNNASSTLIENTLRALQHVR